MCQLCSAPPSAATNDADVGAFEERFIAAMNEAAMIAMASLGHRTGLFDAMADGEALTSSGLAAKAGLDERYVREWLGAMVCAGIVVLDDGSGTYILPRAHAARLTRTASPNLAVMAQFMPLLSAVEDDIVGCFRNGGGVPYARFGRFHEVMAEESGQTVLPELEASILPLVPRLQRRLADGIAVLDVGCGRARALMQMAERYPKSQFTGLDLSEEAIDWARSTARARGLANIKFRTQDLADFDRAAPLAAYDLITSFDAIHDQPQPMAMIKGIRRALAPGGVYLAQDIKGSGSHAGDRDNPIGTLLYTISCMHCMTVSLAQGGAGLGAMWGRSTAESMFTEAGFGSVEVHELAHDLQNYYYVCRA
ncbi:MAG: methyltransferase domain-containing protein [Hyphomicrobiaceae bacterium]|nr:methyltransferase domain-containing protein [Hyphomicrobiaceae bacterium]